MMKKLLRDRPPNESDPEGAGVAKPVDEGDESVLWKIVEQRNLFAAIFAPERLRRRDVAECAIQIVVLGGDAGRLGGPAAGQLLVRADREQLDLLLRAAESRSAIGPPWRPNSSLGITSSSCGLRRDPRVPA